MGLIQSILSYFDPGCSSFTRKHPEYILQSVSAIARDKHKCGSRLFGSPGGTASGIIEITTDNPKTKCIRVSVRPEESKLILVLSYPPLDKQAEKLARNVMGDSHRLLEAKYSVRDLPRICQERGLIILEIEEKQLNRSYTYD